MSDRVPVFPAGPLRCPMPGCRWHSDPANLNSPARQYSHHLMFQHEGWQMDQIPPPLPYRPWAGLALVGLIVVAWLPIIAALRLLGALLDRWLP